MEDKTIICTDCKAPFIFTVEGQIFYDDESISDPCRCKFCQEIYSRNLHRKIPDLSSIMTNSAYWTPERINAYETIAAEERKKTFATEMLAFPKHKSS